ncbi:MAG: alanine racemase [Candidatus Marinimicrobia bacterium]|nr:alanine racemase [Candidatus Neomarinimicrobiota bacterium]
MRIVPSADINLENLRYNYGVIRERTGDARIFAVVKADAYGHGLIPIAKSLEKMGIDGFCVAVISELEQLISGAITKPILHLGRLHKEVLEIKHQYNIWYTVNSFEDISLLEWASKKRTAPIVVHLKIDTGMGRLGIPVEESMKLAIALTKIPYVKLEGLWSHLSTSEEENGDYFYRQLELFKLTTKKIQSKIGGIKFLHLANSAAALKYPESHFNLVRPGIALFGATTSKPHQSVLKPVMSLNAPVSLVKHLKKGDSIGYNRTEILKQNKTIAIVQAGYADGISVQSSDSGFGLCKGQLFPFIGKVSMDMLTIDVTGSDIQPGDMVNLWGGNHPKMKVEAVAASLGKIPYELLVSISGRIEKKYTENQN